ncbi:MAG: DUF2851 family protein [Opitutae bacterium]
MVPTLQHVAELQGLYGPFTMAERVVQKIWLRGDFNLSRAGLSDGQSLVIRSAGVWNLQAGPDFLGARLVLGGREVTGDIEVHFHASDWRAHGHAADCAYANVVLHVVMFPPAVGEAPARHADGRVIPTLVLLPLLHRDLEEYASDDALEVITARDQWEPFADLAALPLAARQALIRRHAGERWRQKVHFARRRIAQLGWTAALHQTALEILGYRHNRAAMLAVATRYPLEAWNAAIKPEALLEEFRTRWQAQGLRPANHPLNRLRQYQCWVAGQPDWPQRLLELLPAPPPLGGETGDSTRSARQRLGLKALRARLARDLLSNTIGGTRMDNLVADGFLPMLAARTGGEFQPTWHHWYLGDIPTQWRRALPRLGLADGRDWPYCQGCAQGLLGWILERQARASG